MNTRDRSTSPARRLLALSALGLAVLMVLAACGIGGSSGSKSNATATTSTTINLEASPTAATSPVAVGTPVSSPVAATPGAPGQTGAQAATPAATTSAATAATPASRATRAAATKETKSSEPPVVTSCSPDSIPPFTGKKANYQVSVDGLNFRAGPGTDCDPLGDPLAIDTPVKVISDPVVRKGEKDKWVEVEVNGQDGWVAEQYIKPAS